MQEPVQRLFATLALVAGVISIAGSPRLALANPKESITSEPELSTKDKQEALHENLWSHGEVVATSPVRSSLLTDSQVIYRKAFGLANREHGQYRTQLRQYLRLASVSKQFCSLITMQLIQDGKLSTGPTQLQAISPAYRQDTGERITHPSSD